MTNWQVSLDSLGPAAREQFSTLESVFRLRGTTIARDNISEVIRVEADGKGYFVKRYTAAGNDIQRWVGRSRIESEWRNLQHFAEWGIPTIHLVAYGQQRWLGIHFRGAMVTDELPGSIDLARLARRPHPSQTPNLQVLIDQVAEITRVLHAHGFTHNDLHWRNLLLDEMHGRVHLIDCPKGAFWWPGPLLQYRIAKDLASLDKFGRKYLTRTQRLRFYLKYAGINKLDQDAKRAIHRVTAAYNHRMRRKGLPTDDAE